MFRGLLSIYSLRFPRVIAYMLQSTEYQVGPYLRWFWQTTNFSSVMYRRQLDPTRPARLLMLALRIGIGAQLLIGLFCLYLWHWQDTPGMLYFGLAIIISYPLVWAHVVALPLELGRLFIIRPQQQRQIARSEKIFAAHPGARIAIAGSYGKTSMKELLTTVLSEGKRVAATPANKNVSISHAVFAQKLSGEEEVLLIEYGEGQPGDVKRFAQITHPTHAVIAGIAPAHLDQYGTTERAAEDIFSVTTFVEPNHVFVNNESLLAQPYITKRFMTYDRQRALDWKISDIVVTLQGTSFTMKHGKRTLRLSSQLVGRHQVGPLAFAAALAHQLGMTDTQIATGIAKTIPFEHRMQPYELDGAWIIDDTYNGNIEGIRAGTALLKELPARRKIYVSPGLVDQGIESDAVHEQMGELIAEARPDIVVLMQNSATAAIKRGLEGAAFAGDVLTEDDPLTFYTNLQTFVAAGDVVLMQNDWTDNYL